MLLVTGSTGHLGANLVRRLLADGHEVRVLLRPNCDETAVEGLRVEKVYGDLREPEACKLAVRGCRGVHHTAAVVSTVDGGTRLKRDIYETNVLGTRYLLRAAHEAGVEKVVVTGSFSAVGHHRDRPSGEEEPFNPFEQHLPYGFSKAAVEHECLKAFADGLPVVVATSCAILGPNDFKPSRMGRLLCDFANQRLWFYPPGGFEFVAAADMVQGHLLAMDKGRPGQKYIFSTRFLTVADIMGIYEEITGVRRPKLQLPLPLLAALARVADPVLRLFPALPRRFTPAAVRILRMHRHADITKARTELGYQPGNITDAIREAYEFFAGRGLIARKAMAPVAQRLEMTT